MSVKSAKLYTYIFIYSTTTTLQNKEHISTFKPQTIGNDEHLLVFSQLDSLDLSTKGKFSNALELMIVPEHHFVIWPLRTFAPSDQGQDVAPIEHLYDANSTVDVSHELPSEWQSVENPESGLGADSEAILVLIEANVANIL